MIQLKRTLKHKAGLRHRAFGGVHQQKHAVDHFKHTLHLAAEIGVTGCVNDIDLDTVVMHCGVFGKDRNSALTFNVARIHNAGAHFLIVAENTALLQHLVDQCGLAVVNVGDDGNIS